MERLPGFRDFYPEPLPNSDVWSADTRQHIFCAWRRVAQRYGFREYDGPPLEELDLYTTKSGAEIVGQLYNFQDKGGRDVALRPEMTPTLARMVAAHERGYKKPIKWFAIPQLFRYERQQKGRLREHFQLNADLIGEKDPGADAELIALVIDSLRELNLSSDDFVIRLSSRNAWGDFYRRFNGDPAREYEFYQVIDKLERETPEETEKKLSILGIPAAEVASFVQRGEPTRELQSIVDNLSARGMASFIKVDYQVIRGLAYYTGVVFEAFDRKGEFRAIAGGGRYDNLIKLISGSKVDLPALGFGMGDVVLAELLRSRDLLPKSSPNLDAYCLIEDETLRQDSLTLIQSLRAAGLATEYPLTPLKPDKQFKRAQELEATSTVRLQRTAEGGLQARVRNLKTRNEETAAVDDVLRLLRTKV